MGQVSVAAFRPRVGREAELRDVLIARVPLLQRLGLLTMRPVVTMRSRSGVMIQVSEWESEEAIAKAHNTPEVLELWARFDACSEYVRLATLDEANEPFATFESFDL